MKTGAGVTKSASTSIVVNSNQYVACRSFACSCIECEGEPDTILWSSHEGELNMSIFGKRC